jgi:hypothetical protein
MSEEDKDIVIRQAGLFVATVILSVLAGYHHEIQHRHGDKLIELETRVEKLEHEHSQKR